MKTEKPILFSGEMVRAILDGRKTQTRRIVNPQPSEFFEPTVGLYHPTEIDKHGNEVPGKEVFGASSEDEGYPCPYPAGTELWVKETFYDCRCDTKKKQCVYRADADTDVEIERDFKWKPSIYMPRNASRITLEVTQVRVQRIQEISEEDAKAEGCLPIIHSDGTIDCGTRKTTFARLWDSINSKRDGGQFAWDKSPWVWVYDFRRITP